MFDTSVPEIYGETCGCCRPNRSKGSVRQENLILIIIGIIEAIVIGLYCLYIKKRGG